MLRVFASVFGAKVFRMFKNADCDAGLVGTFCKARLVRRIILVAGIVLISAVPGLNPHSGSHAQTKIFGPEISVWAKKHYKRERKRLELDGWESRAMADYASSMRQAQIRLEDIPTVQNRKLVESEIEDLQLQWQQTQKAINDQRWAYNVRGPQSRERSGRALSRVLGRALTLTEYDGLLGRMVNQRGGEITLASLAEPAKRKSVASATQTTKHAFQPVQSKPKIPRPRGDAVTILQACDPTADCPVREPASVMPAASSSHLANDLLGTWKCTGSYIVAATHEVSICQGFLVLVGQTSQEIATGVRDIRCQGSTRIDGDSLWNVEARVRGKAAILNMSFKSGEPKGQDHALSVSFDGTVIKGTSRRYPEPVSKSNWQCRRVNWSEFKKWQLDRLHLSRSE